MIFDVKKEYGRCKARHVVGGYVVDSSHVETFSSMVQSMSIRMTLTMVKSHHFKVMGGCSGNPFPPTQL